VVEGFLDDVVREAKVLERGRKGEWDCPMGEVGWEEVLENAGCEADNVVDLSDAAD